MHQSVQLDRGMSAFKRAVKKTALLQSAARILAAEFVDPSGRIKHLLLAGVEGMTSGTNFDTEIVSKRGPGNKLVAAAAGYFDFRIGGMYVGFHDGWHRW